MIKISQITTKYQQCITGLHKRGITNAQSLLDEIVEVDRTRKATQIQLDEALHQSRIISKQIGLLLQQNKKTEAEQAKSATNKQKAHIKTLQTQFSNCQDKLNQLLYNIPNIPHVDVPSGHATEDNQIVKESASPPTPALASDSCHWDLVRTYNIIDFELGNKITGAGFPFYIGQGARLVRGLINYFLDKACDAGYQEVHPPLLINEASGRGTGQLPDKEGQMYRLAGHPYYLVPTAEVPLTNMYRNETLSDANLPVKITAYTPCFRSEAGSWGSDVRGLNRLHQFDKVEIVQFTHPKNSYQTLEKMVSYVENLVQQLELPYRILRLCGKDLGFTASMTYDIEVYAKAQKKWLEVSSISNFESYQANRLNLKIKDGEKKIMAHTLNGSALALPRIIAALLENNQTTEGILMPKKIIEYTGFDKILPPSNPHNHV